MSDRITIFDTTLRDGEQSPGASMNLEEKLQVARQLERMNVDVIEAGFAIASQGDFEAVQAVARAMKKASVASLCRASKRDIDRAWEALKEARKPRIHTFIATSDIHVKRKLQKTHDQVRQAKHLATIVSDAPVQLDLDAAELAAHFDRERVLELFRELEFRSLIERVPAAATRSQRRSAAPATGRQDQLPGR